MELFGRGGYYLNTEQPWLRVSVTLSATLPHDESLPLPAPDAWRRSTTRRQSPKTDDGEELSDQIEYRAFKANNLFPTQFANPEHIILAREVIEHRKRILFQAIDGDPELEEVLEVLMNGCDPRARYIAEELGVPVKDIYNRKRRLQRRISRLMQGEDL